MSDPELGVTKCFFCKNARPLLTPNKKQKSIWLELESEEEAKKNLKYCAECMHKCDKKFEKRELKRKRKNDSRSLKSSSQTTHGSFAAELPLESSESSGEGSVSSIDHNQNKSKNTSTRSTSVRSGQHTVIHRPAEKDTDSEDSSLIINLPIKNKKPSQNIHESIDSQLSQSSARKRPASSYDDENAPGNKKNKPNEQSIDNHTPIYSQSTIGTNISSLEFDHVPPVIDLDDDDDDLLVPQRSNASENAQQPSGLDQGQQKKVAHGTAAPPDDDDDGNSSNSNSDNSHSSRRTAIASQSNRISNASQSSINNRSHDKDLAANNRISGSAPSQKHGRLRKPPPTRAFTPEEQERLRDRSTRNIIFGNYERPNGA